MDNNSPPPPYTEVAPAVDTKQPPPPEAAPTPNGVSFPPNPQFPAPSTNGAANGTSQAVPKPPTVVNMPTLHLQSPLYGPLPTELDCPYCQTHIVTDTQRIAGALPWIIFGVCAVLGFFFFIPWCVCCIPFCIDPCLDVLHSCPSCKRVLGRFSRIRIGNVGA
ncbi:hypothetical protein QR680_009908 [Steinernema hermaphroditum]|uniref:LITAF domain-containing protein n=1 Tax=Steinernema hermaphroditum TaxID=289476 RepID=A0AA39IM22_9BILA|nr:hypothetical protein QR680_009908 [Steinernema hermaphroditum]